MAEPWGGSCRIGAGTVIRGSLPTSAFGRETRGRLKYICKIDQIPQIPPDERERLKKVAERYAFRVNDYYLGLIDWNDPDDPIRRLVIPREQEISGWGDLDASNEQAVTVARGVQHKYPHTVLLLCTEVCAAYCRYCFRKRLFMNENDEASNDVSSGLAYIAGNPVVTNVLLTGGDPLVMSTRRLVEILDSLRQIPHVKIIRLGTKMPAFDPQRILNDWELQRACRQYSTARKRIYLMAHFDHPRELTDLAVESIDCFLRNGVICVNQCPLIKGINDDSAVLSTLFQELAYIGCPPYYLFQCRPTAGNDPYKVPLVRGWKIFSQAMRQGSGLARRAHYVMSHETGKIEILAVDRKHIYLRYHRAKDAALRQRLLTYKRSDDACWLDELEPADGSDAAKFSSSSPFEVTEGPE